MSEIEENIEENFDNYICQFTWKRDCLDEVNDDDDENSGNKSNANKRKQKKNDNDEVSQLLL